MKRPAAGLVGLAQVAVHVFFRRLELAGFERLPAGGPAIVVANHVNALVDPALLLGTLPLPLRFLGKSTLWQIAALRPFLAAAGVIPVYRRQDGVDPAKNDETFARCREVLAAGGVIAMFPEGISHNEPSLAPLRTGAARLALEAEDTAAAAGTTLGVRIVPVGLVFEAKGTFRSRALVQAGEPIDVSRRRADRAAGPDPATAVRELTERIDAALRQVTLNYASAEEGRLLERAAGLWALRRLELPRPARLAAAADLRRAFVRSHRLLEQGHPERVAAMRRAVERYDRILTTFDLRDEQVVASYPAIPTLRFLSRTMGFLLPALPVAAVGFAVNTLPYLAVKALARRLVRSDDVAATAKLFGGLVLYPLAWIACALAAALAAGGAAAAGVLLLGPLSGFLAQLWRERLAMLVTETRAFLLLRTREELTDEIRRRREDVQQAVEGLARLLGDDGDPPPPI